MSKGGEAVSTGGADAEGNGEEERGHSNDSNPLDVKMVEEDINIKKLSYDNLTKEPTGVEVVAKISTTPYQERRK